jgi:hypothetical protein
LGFGMGAMGHEEPGPERGNNPEDKRHNGSPLREPIK